MGAKHKRQPTPESVSTPWPPYHPEQPEPRGISKFEDDERETDDFPMNTELIDHYKILRTKIESIRSKRGVWNSQSKNQLESWIETIDKALEKLQAGDRILLEVWKEAQRKRGKRVNVCTLTPSV